MSSARKEVASWDDTFMAIAANVAMRSKDPHTQVGACIASVDKRVLSLGYNGTPRGWSDDDFPWGKNSGFPLQNKHLFVVHAERNAILNYRGSLTDFKGAVLYSTHYPCNECAKEIVQVGIDKVIYINGPRLFRDEDDAATMIFNKARVSYDRYGRGHG